MTKYNIPKDKLDILYSSYTNCAYCSKKLIFPYDKNNKNVKSYLNRNKNE